MRRVLSISTVCVLLLSTCVGCSTLAKGKTNAKDGGWAISKLWKKEYQQPQQMAAIWTHDILASTGKTPTRGFGGRVYFYNERSQPIPVDGELIVHGFEEKPGIVREYTTESDKRFRFTAEQFTSHYSESELGASYSIWLPWDAADGAQREITLIPTFKTSKGQVVQGAPAKLVLPGKGSPTADPQSPVQTVAYQRTQTPTVDGPLPRFSPQTKSAPSNEGGMTTTTINLPPRTSQRLSNPSFGSESSGSTNQERPASFAPSAESNEKVQEILDRLQSLNQINPTTQPTIQSQQLAPQTPSGFTSTMAPHSAASPAQSAQPTTNSFGAANQLPFTSGLQPAQRSSGFNNRR